MSVLFLLKSSKSVVEKVERVLPSAWLNDWMPDAKPGTQNRSFMCVWRFVQNLPRMDEHAKGRSYQVQSILLMSSSSWCSSASILCRDKHRPTSAYKMTRPIILWELL